MRRSLFLVPILFLSACSAQISEEPMIDATGPEFSGKHSIIDTEKSEITFLGKSTIINHPGSFEDFSARLELYGNDPSDLARGHIAITIQADSIQSNDERLTNHLKSEEFFDVENHPEITFSSIQITHVEGNTYAIDGELNVKGNIADVRVTAAITDETIGFMLDVPRKALDIGNDSYGDKLLDDMVPVEGQFVFKQ